MALCETAQWPFCFCTAHIEAIVVKYRGTANTVMIDEAPNHVMDLHGYMTHRVHIYYLPPRGLVSPLTLTLPYFK